MFATGGLERFGGFMVQFCGSVAPPMTVSEGHSERAGSCLVRRAETRQDETQTERYLGSVGKEA
jgi:hypothetical protein